MSYIKMKLNLAKVYQEFFFFFLFFFLSLYH